MVDVSVVARLAVADVDVAVAAGLAAKLAAVCLDVAVATAFAAAATPRFVHNV